MIFLVFFFKVRSLFRIEEVSESDVSLIVSWRFEVFRKMGVGLGCTDEAICAPDGPAVFDVANCGAIGLNLNICVRSGLFRNASSCFGFLLGILIFNDLAILLAVEIHDRPDETTLTSSVCLLLRLIFLSPVFFRVRSRLCFWIFLFECFFVDLFRTSLYILCEFRFSFSPWPKFSDIRIPNPYFVFVWLFYHTRRGAYFAHSASWC